jgi:hypothetical protein
MKLSAAVLDEIASTLRTLSKNNINVTEFEVQGFLISVTKEYGSDITNGPMVYYATSIRPRMVMHHGVPGVRGSETFDPAG